MEYKKLTLIGLCGKAQVGKDTTADYLVRTYGFKKMALADYLKQVAELGGWNGLKDTAGRTYLQHLGDVMREYDKDIFIKEMLSRIYTYTETCDQFKTEPKVVISDVRLPQEIEAINEIGGRLWLIKRETGLNHTHITELLDENSYPFDTVLDNGGSFEQLYSGIQQTIKRYEKSR